MEEPEQPAAGLRDQLFPQNCGSPRRVSILDGLAADLLTWYDEHGRSLPWRTTNPDPYAVWVSEIMLQQTRVEAVIPYYRRWMERFPTLAALAQAEQREVLAAWEGLGYYSRARNLHRAAQMVHTQLDGSIPATAQALRSLPGVGAYTAGAIASIAFGQDEPALDGNIRRVLARVENVTLPARSPAGEKLLWEIARRALPSGRAGDFNQALMDLGSRICTPREPNCPVCPIRRQCEAYRLGVQEQRPVLDPKPDTPHYLVTAAVIQGEGRVLIAQRPAEKLLGGLWEFPGGKVEPGETLAEGLAREIREELGVDIMVGDPLGIYKHGYSHFKVTLHAFLCRLPAGAEPQPLQHTALAWAAPAELDGYPMGKIDRSISRDLQRGPGPTQLDLFTAQHPE